MGKNNYNLLWKKNSKNVVKGDIMMNEYELTNDTNDLYIEGELLHMIFYNEQEHFVIAKIKVTDQTESYDEDAIVIKGHFPPLQEGTTYRFYGAFEQHASYGTQYKISSYETVMPNTEEGVIAYLSSDLFYGIGEKTAGRIIEHLGVHAISRILNDPSIVQTIPKISKQVEESLVKTLQENQGFEHVVVFLSNYQIGLKLAQKMYELYKDETIEKLMEDPYQFVYEVEMFGFQTADRIARQNGLAVDHPNRIGAGTLYILQQHVQNGHVYTPIQMLLRDVHQLLGFHDIDIESIERSIQQLHDHERLIVEDDRVYSRTLFYAEHGFVSQIERIQETDVEIETPLAQMLQVIGKVEEEEIISYGKEQFDAINEALHKKIMILTGGPGTGKTTVIKGILHAYAAIHDVEYDIEHYETKSEYPFVLTAPTGRAAKRLQESTNIPAVTIHRLLGWDGNDTFEKNQFNPLAGKIIIVDEFSMVDMWLAHDLFKAIPDDMQILLVGDEDQLPSVGPGQVLADLIASESVPFTTLEEVYRQKEGSKIIQLAHHIKNDTCTVEELHKATDFSFIDCHVHQVFDVVTKIYQSAMNKGIDVHDIQLLAPMYRSAAGINALNEHIQQLVNPPDKGKREIHFKNVVFRVGDKVIQLVNQPEEGVSNGDIGEVVSIFRANENVDQEEQIVVLFDDKEVVYHRSDYMNISHAYCVSIHKSQGSEFPIVLMPVFQSYNRMLRKNLLYTAITRAQHSLIICGEKDSFLRGVQTLDTKQRHTYLVERLRAHFTSEENESLVLEVDEEEESISPYDFMD